MDAANHATEEPATVRGTAPCGKVLNVCGKFAVSFQAYGFVSVRCQCGRRHFASSFRFVKI